MALPKCNPKYSTIQELQAAADQLQVQLDALQAAIDELEGEVHDHDATYSALGHDHAGSPTLPVVDETPLVYKTGIPDTTLTFDVNAFTVPRTWIYPNAASIFAGLNVVGQTFTVEQVFNAGMQSYKNGVTQNVIMGTLAGNPTMTAENIIALGNKAGNALTSGNGNILIGGRTGESITNATNNVCMGQLAGLFLTGGSNLYLGTSSGRGATTGANNVGLGYQTLYALAAGQNNVAVGTLAFEALTGTGGVAIGYRAGQQETTGNKLYIANSSTVNPLIYGDFSTGLLTVNTLDAGTDTIVNTLSLNHVLSSGNVAQGHGTALLAKLQTSTTPGQSAGRLYWLWPSTAGATHATRASRGGLTAFYTTNELVCIGWGAASATDRLLGFYDIAATPISQPAAVADATGAGDVVAQLNSLLARMRSLGLIAT